MTCIGLVSVVLPGVGAGNYYLDADRADRVTNTARALKFPLLIILLFPCYRVKILLIREREESSAFPMYETIDKCCKLQLYLFVVSSLLACI